ncbi:MAG: hypothetical protein L0I76_33940, partial [Pseudonocardia sp.]|nr:hypothetical protein [Pseudonocardia sp.]
AACVPALRPVPDVLPQVRRLLGVPAHLPGPRRPMTYELVILCLLIALIVLGRKKSKGSLVGGLLMKGPKGQIGLKLWPAGKPGKKRKKSRR